MKRRTFIQAGIAGSALAAVGGVVWLVRTTGYSRLAGLEKELHHFSQDEAAVLGALAGWFNPHDALETEAQIAQRVLFIDRMFDRIAEDTTKEFRALIHLFEHGPLLFGLSVARFTRMEPSAQRDYLTGWQTSGIGVRRLGFNAMKSLMYMSAYRNENSWSRIGYDGPLVDADWDPEWRADYDALVAPPNAKLPQR